VAKVLIAFTTRSGETKKIAEYIAEGLRMAGHQVELKNTSDIPNEAGLAGYDGYLFGSPTYHGDMMNSMKTLLFLAEKAGLEGKVGGAFGAFGWSGEAPQRIFETMKNIFKMKMTGDFLRLKSVALEGGVQMAQGYGRDLGTLF